MAVNQKLISAKLDFENYELLRTFCCYHGLKANRVLNLLVAYILADENKQLEFISKIQMP